LQWKSNGKSYGEYRIAPIPMTLSEPEGHFYYHFCLSNSNTYENIVLLTMIRLHINRIAHVACNFKCPLENEEFFKVTRSRILCT